MLITCRAVRRGALHSRETDHETACVPNPSRRPGDCRGDVRRRERRRRPGAKPAVPGAPHAKAVTIVIFENRDFAKIVGSKDAPYLNATLVPQAAVMTNS